METERNIILDCDTGEDDALAILTAIASQLPLHYIVTSHGNTSIENSTRNTSRILSTIGNGDVKVVRGSANPLQKHIHYPDGYSAGSFVGNNGLCNLELPPSNFDNIILSADDEIPEFLSGLLKKESPVDYVVTGPSTNLARACRYLGDEIHDHVKNVYIMGGALFHEGNSGPLNPQTQQEEKLAEFNFYCDPEAINVVLGSRLSIHLVTWDITSSLTVPKERLEGLSAQSEIGTFTLELMNNFFKYHGLEHGRSFELNDPITVMAVNGWGHEREIGIRVLTSYQEYGKSVLEPNGYKVKYFYLFEEEKPKIIDAVLTYLDVK